MEKPANIIAEKKQFFAEQINHVKESQLKFKNLTNRFGFFRIIYFIATIVVAVYFINERNGSATAMVLIPFPVIFGWLVNRHSKHKRKLNIASNKITFLENEMSRLDLSLSHLDGGTEFQDFAHPYTPDLDVFGRHSLFSLINRSALNFGRNTLANWFLSAANIETIQARQKAAASLQNEHEWRMEWFAEGHLKELEEVSDQAFLFNWFEDDQAVKSNALLKIIPAIGLIQLAMFAVLAFLGILPWGFVGLGLLINILLLLPVQRRIMEVYRATEKVSDMLQQHKNLFKMAEDKNIDDPYLKDISKVFKNPSASDKIKSLSTILSWLHSRNGMMYWIINPFILSDYWITLKSLSWKQNYGKFLRKWFMAIGEWEAVLSLSAYAFAHPHYIKAEITDKEAVLEGKDLGHPLLPHHERVNNDFLMEGKGAVTLITGANMSGKSTFERSIGVNLVLAQMGAVCCAEKLVLSPLRVFTSMRTQDNLEENTSSFYAELKRLKKLVDLTQENNATTIFYLLDEILKGTNSEDRNIGAESLIRQLMKTNSIGLISTHDLSLAKLETQLEKFQNYSFNSDVSGNEILFDYKLNEGPCHTFNAVPLMKKMGIEIV